MLGKTVGKYRIVERLGRGGMGTVYKAVDETLDRDVAIKVLNADLGDTDLMKRFRAEAVTLARLNHPNIATLYELHRSDDDLLMVMEFVRGETLHDLSERLGAVAPPQAAHLAMQVLDALAHAHRAGVVHRDLKPANLMITETGTVKVMDFGIARVLGTEHFTQGGYMMGTPAYMAPEQVLGGEIDGRADLYAVGVVLYRLLSGQLPFSADTAIAMVQKQVNESPTPVTDFQPDLPPWCGAILERALAKAPADRFQTADEFRTALLSAVQPQTLGELPTVATPTPPGLLLGSDFTRAHTGASTLAIGSNRVGSRGGATALATPVTVPLAAVATATPAAAPTPTPTASRPADASTTTVVLGRKHLVALGAIVLVLFVGLAAVGFLALRRTAFPQQLQIGARPAEETQGAAATPVPVATSTTGTPEAGGVPAPAPTAPVPPAAPKAPADGDAGVATAGSLPPGAARSARAGGPTDGLVPPPPVPPGARGARGTTAAATEAPISAATAPSSPTGLPPVRFKDVRLLVTNAGKTQELEGVLAIGEGRVSVLDKNGGAPLMSLPYSALTGGAYSRSKQPKWRDESGKEISRDVELGKLGFLKSERNWVILFSHSDPIIFRVEDGSLRTVLPALEQRAGIKVRR